MPSLKTADKRRGVIAASATVTTAIHPGCFLILSSIPAACLAQTGPSEPQVIAGASTAKISVGSRKLTGHVVATVRVGVDGRVKEVLVDEGATVEAGQVVARMDTEALEARLREALAKQKEAEDTRDVANADVSTKQALIGTRSSDVAVRIADSSRTQAMPAPMPRRMEEAGLPLMDSLSRGLRLETGAWRPAQLRYCRGASAGGVLPMRTRSAGA